MSLGSGGEGGIVLSSFQPRLALVLSMNTKFMCTHICSTCVVRLWGAVERGGV